MEQIISLRAPPLLIGDQSAGVLRGIARAARLRAPEVVERLLEEVDRADVVAESDVPDDIVRLGSLVTYRVLETGAVATIQLVAPHAADLPRLRVSVVSAIGAALIGLKPGQRIEWELGGRGHVLEVLRVAKVA